MKHVASPLVADGAENDTARFPSLEEHVAFRTARYADTPLVVSGPGAGPEVTAAGILGDIINLASTM